MFKYFGSKYKLGGVYPEPLYDVIVEPFAGAAAYSVRHGAARRVILIEKDKRVVATWERLLAMSAEEIRAMPDPTVGDESDVLLVALAAGRTTRDTPEWFKVSPRMAQRFRPMVERVAANVDRCRHFEVKCGDFTEAPDIEATWFIDPPYQFRGGRWDRTRGGRYRHPNVEIDFGALSAWTQARRGQVVACDQEGADWLPWNGAVEARAGTHGTYREVWWARPTMEGVVMPLFRCPSDDEPITGCGEEFEAEPARDPDGYVDCPHCGLFFDPENDANRREAS